MHNYQEFVDIDCWKTMIDREKSHPDYFKKSQPTNKQLVYPVITKKNLKVEKEIFERQIAKYRQNIDDLNILLVKQYCGKNQLQSKEKCQLLAQIDWYKKEIKSREKFV